MNTLPMSGRKINPLWALLFSLGVLLAMPSGDAIASHAGGMDAMSIDMDPSASPANTATSLGTLESCARINENNVMDADEDPVDIDGDTVADPDTLGIDVTATNIPAGYKMIAFRFVLGYDESNLTVQSATHSFLLAANGGSSLFNGSDPTPDADANNQWTAAVIDTGPIPSSAESGSGVLSRINLSSDTGAAVGVYTLILRPDSGVGDGSIHVDTGSTNHSPDALNNAAVAVNTVCPPPGPYTVDAVSDTFLNACTGAAGDCSLRGAMGNAAALSGAQTITFDSSVFPPTCPCPSWVTASSLPTLSGDGDTIDATGAGVFITATGADPCFNVTGNGNKIIGIDEITGCGTAIQVSGASNSIGGTNSSESGGQCVNAVDDDSDDSVNDGCPASGAPEAGIDCAFAVDNDLDTLVNDGCPPRGQGIQIDGNTQEGILITGEAADSNTVIGNWIGVNGSLSAASANDTGIRIGGGADSNTIGGTTVGDRNLISGNTNNGVEITGGSTTGNTIRGNYIGTNAAGTGPLGNGGPGVALLAAGNTVGGLTSTPGAAPGNVISDNNHGIVVYGEGADGNIIQGNLIGTDAAGTGPLGNADVGVWVLSGADSNVVGGSSTSARNVISDNGRGVAVFDAGTTLNEIRGNYIGTDLTGTADLGNSHGITLAYGSASSTIGGLTAAERNVISGNGEGIVLGEAGTSTTGNTILGNYIGTAAGGTSSLANSGSGVLLQDGSTGNTIGGTAAGARNVISGNDGDGVLILGSASSGNLIRGNYIGTDYTGNATGLGVRNDGDGIDVRAPFNTIGAITAGGRNVVGGNGGAGIIFQGAGTTGNQVMLSYIGIGADGVSAVGNTGDGIEMLSDDGGEIIGDNALPAGNRIAYNGGAGISISSINNSLYGNTIFSNASHGVEVQNSNNSISGDSLGGPNSIHLNGGDGVFVSAGTGNVIRANAIFGNAQLGIDLAGGSESLAGVTVNDSGDGDSGPNALMNYPHSLGATYDGTVTTIYGYLDTTTGTATVDVYANDVGDASSGNGEGRIFVGSVPVATGGGPVSWAVSVLGAPQYGIFTATATDSSGNTSEFSAYLNNDIDGDGFLSSVDNCDFADNLLQIDHDADGGGDVCDSVVRNRFSAATTASIVTELTTAPGQELPDAHQFFYPWDIQPGSGITVGSIVGEIDLSFDIALLANSPCTTSVLYSASKLINASTDSSAGNLIDTSGILGDTNTNGIPDGAEKFPKFLTTLLDPERRSYVDEDNDGLVDEDPEGGINSDGDGLLDEDGTGTPAPLHARYFTAPGDGNFVQILVQEITADQLYRVAVVVNDPVTPAPGAIEACAPLEFRHKTQDTSSDNPATGPVEGGQTILNTPGTGTKVFRLQSSDPADADADGIGNAMDKCPVTYDPTQADTDADWLGDVCDPAPATPIADEDGDAVANSRDNCATVINATQRDAEVRTPAPFGSPVRDSIGDACDPDPTVVNDVDLVGLNDYSDPICVTGGGVSDSDGDGWCDANDPGGAAVTPEGMAPGGIVVPGSCTNGLDDDLDMATDFDDTDCADADGDGVPDNLDICDAAADPLQLDSDTSTAAGDACEANNIVSFHPVSTAAGANSELRERLVEVAPKPLHRSDGIVTVTDPDWTIAAGSAVADGAIRAALTGTYVTSIAPDPTCNKIYSFQFTLIDASTSTASTITPGTNFSNLVADSDADGIPNGAEQFPSFLANVALASARLNNDADFAFDEDRADLIDNDGDGSVDEDPYDPVTPLARLFGYSTSPAGANSVMNVLIYSPGALPGVPAADGYASIFVINDPALNLSPLSGICSPLDATFYQYGSTLDNPRTSPDDEDGTALLTNPSPGSTERFFTNITTQPDADGDLIENSLDTCSLVADNDADTLPDQSDPTPWNPRLVSPPGDTIDRDGIPAGCDPNPTVPGFRFSPGIVGSCSNVATDSDCDGVNNTADNCSTLANSDQTDSDADGMGDICDSDRWRPTGAQTVDSQGTPACIGGTDNDKDGFCAGFAQENDSSGDYVPEASAYLGGFVCTNSFDDDQDGPVDLADNGCGDADADWIINEQDNCPLTNNGPNDPTNQTDNDADSAAHANAQPWQRSATDPTIITGPVSTVIGEPFQRSDKWGGDACDPDDDNDLLPDPYDPCQYDADCDNDGLEDWWEYQWPGCLNVQVAQDREANPDGDAVFTYGEATVTITSPCVTNLETSFNGDEDGDGTKSGPERWLRTGPLNRCEQGAPYGNGPSGAWGADLAGDDDKINVLDLSTYVGTPRRLNTKLLDGAFDPRWDLTPGPSAPGGSWIDVLDIQTVFQVQPPMPPYLGSRAFQATGPGGTPLTCTN